MTDVSTSQPVRKPSTESLDSDDLLILNRDLLSLKSAANYAVRSSPQPLQLVSKVNCPTLDDRVFGQAAPFSRNSVQLTIRTSCSLVIFKRQLITFF